jgi:hypothetical protein
VALLRARAEEGKAARDDEHGGRQMKSHAVPREAVRSKAPGRGRDPMENQGVRSVDSDPTLTPLRPDAGPYR